ncbi:MAG: tetratricopeptide repeat protein [Nitrospira sp.]|nr:tetratricopeptide repeat protein [Nitrospira sp.]
MPIPPDVKEQLDLIIRSLTFRGQRQARALLTLLCETSEPLAAIDIADRMALATKDTARTAVTRLRDLLDQYYADEGKLNKFRLKIEGRPYKVLIEKQPVPTSSPSPETSLNDEDLRPPSILPARNNLTQRWCLGNRFVGRTEELRQLHQLLRGPAIQGPVVSVSGFAGVGKSQFAIEYCYRFGHSYPDGVFWLDAATDYGQLAGELGAYGEILFNPQLESQQQLGYMWKQLGKRGQEPHPTILVVLDNLSVDRELLPLLPLEPTIATIVTTQRRALTEHEINLPFLSAQESLALLNSGRKHNKHTAEECAPLIEMLEGLPYALELIRGRLDWQPSLTLTRLVKELHAVPAFKGWDRSAYRDSLPSAHSKDILATFQQCLLPLDSDQDKQSLKDAKLVMRYLSHLAPAPVPLALLERIERFSQSEGSEDLHLALDELESLSLATRSPSTADSGTTVAVHRLMLAYVQETERGSTDTLKLLIDVCAALEAEMPTVMDKSFGSASELNAYRRHAVHLYANDLLNPLLRYSLTTWLALADMRMGRLRESRAWAQKAVQLSDTVEIPEGTLPKGATAADLGRFLVIQAEFLLGHYMAARRSIEEIAARKHQVEGFGIAAEIMMGITSMVSGQSSQADSWFQSALETQEPGSEDAIAFANLLAGINLVQAGKYKEAQTSLQRSLLRYERTHPDEVSLSLTRLGLGLLAERLGEYHNAEQIFRTAIVEVEQALGADSHHTLTYRFAYGRCLHYQLRYGEALEQYDQVIRGIPQDLMNHPFMISAHAMRTMVLIELGHKQAAEESLRMTRRLAEAVDETISQLIDFYIAVGRYALIENEFGQAETAFSKAITMMEDIVLDPVLAIPIRIWLCCLLIDQERYSQAQEHIDKSLAALEEYPNHPSIVMLLSLQGRILVQTGRQSEAVTVLNDSLLRGSREPNSQTGATMFWLGKAHLESDAMMAEQVLESAMKIHEVVYPSGHLEIAAGQQMLARAKLMIGKPKEAEELLQHALVTMRSHLPDDTAQIATTLLFLGTAHLNQNDAERAEPLLERAVKIVKALYPTGHLEIAIAQQVLAQAKLKTDKPKEAGELLEGVLTVLPAEAPMRITTQILLGQALSAQNRWNEAEPVWVEALQASEKRYPPGHVELANAKEILGRLNYNLGRYAEAEVLSKQALTIFQQLRMSSRVAQTQRGLGHIYRDWGKLDQAETTVLEALRTFEESALTDGAMHSCHQLSQVLTDQGKYEDARKSLVKVMEYYRYTVPSSEVDSILAICDLGRVELFLNHYNDALTLLDQGLAAWEQRFGKKDPGSLLIRGRKAIAMIKTGQETEGRRMLADAKTAISTLSSEHAGRVRFLKDLKALLD